MVLSEGEGGQRLADSDCQCLSAQAIEEHGRQRRRSATGFDWVVYLSLLKLRPKLRARLDSKAQAGVHRGH